MLHKNANQVPKTIDILLVSWTSVFVLTFTFQICWNICVPKFSEDIKIDAIVKAYQILELERRSESKGEKLLFDQKINKREIAGQITVEKKGTISFDRWNNPYSFQILARENLKRQIVVWSSGPDGQSNSNETIPYFSGDDIGESLVVNF